MWLDTPSTPIAALQVGEIYSKRIQSIIKFDYTNFQGYPASWIESATLRLYVSSITNETHIPLVIQGLLRTATTSFTWNTYNGSNGWTTAGAQGSGTDYNATDMATNDPGSGGQTIPLNTAVCGAMITGNKGLIIKPTSIYNSSKYMSISNVGTETYLTLVVRPRTSNIIIF